MLNLVTGATGMTGSHLVQTLVLRGERVRALVRPTSRTSTLRSLGIDIRVGNLSDNATVAAAADGTDRIYHCAARVADWGEPSDFEQANVKGVRNILAAATRTKVERVVFLSTTDVYGFPGRAAYENERFSPRGYPYADSKIQAEKLIWKHHKTVGLPITIIRPGSLYGPGAQLMVVRAVQALKRRKMILVDEGEHIIGLTYVGNLVDAMLLAASSPNSIGQAYNIADGLEITWRIYMDRLADLTELPHPTRSYSRGMAMNLANFWESFYRLLGRNERPPLTQMMVELLSSDEPIPIDKAREQIGYQPRVLFDEGMRHTVDWLRQTGQID